MNKIRAGIIGTGNIGTDLLMKIIKSDKIEPIIFSGRRKDSDGIKKAEELDVPTSYDGINYFLKNQKCCDVVYDCTNAEDARSNAQVFKNQGIKVIDLTPAKVGEMVIPVLNGNLISNLNNINMVTCGGQASIPLLNLICKYSQDVQYIEVVSQIASKSAGMATRINIDEYIHTTEKAITKFTGCQNTKVILNLNPAEPCVDMQTTMFLKLSGLDLAKFSNVLYERIEAIKKYVPFYELIIPPLMNEDEVLVLSIKVRGNGDYLPTYAGNLDIINCAAINVTEKLLER